MLTIQDAIDWHRKNAKICRDIANEHESRYGVQTLQNALAAAKHHEASATGLQRLRNEEAQSEAKERLRALLEDFET